MDELFLQGDVEKALRGAPEAAQGPGGSPERAPAHHEEPAGVRAQPRAGGPTIITSSARNNGKDCHQQVPPKEHLRCLERVVRGAHVLNEVLVTNQTPKDHLRPHSPGAPRGGRTAAGDVEKFSTI